MNTLLRNSFERLRNRFEEAASDFYGIRCYLVKESYDSGATPVLDAVHQHLSSGTLEAIIGRQYAGVNRTSCGQITYDNTFYANWFVHDRFRQVNTHRATLAENGNEIYAEAKRADECEDRFGELSAEGARLLLDVSPDTCMALEPLLNTPRLTASHFLWLVALFQVALKRSAGLSLTVNVWPPKVVEVDIFEASGSDEFLEHVIYQLNCSPFSASSTFISLLLQKSDTNISEFLKEGVDQNFGEESDQILEEIPPEVSNDTSLDNTQPDEDPPAPQWNNDIGVLTYLDFPPRKYAGQAKNCRMVLAAFQENDWETKMYDPCPGGADPDRVKHTVESLNHGLEGIKFSAADGGESYIWQPSKTED